MDLTYIGDSMIQGPSPTKSRPPGPMPGFGEGALNFEQKSYKKKKSPHKEFIFLPDLVRSQGGECSANGAADRTEGAEFSRQSAESN